MALDTSTASALPDLESVIPKSKIIHIAISFSSQEKELAAAVSLLSSNHPANPAAVYFAASSSLIFGSVAAAQIL